MPSPYGWDQSLTQMASGGMSAWGSTSVPTTPVGNPFIQQSQNFTSFNLSGHVPAQHNNFYAGSMSGYPVATGGGGAFPSGHSSQSRSSTLPNKSAVTASHSSKPNGAGTLTNVTDSANSSVGGGDTGFNLVPNVDFDAWTDADSFFAQYEQSGEMAADNSVEASYKKHQRKSSDLIQLGFEGILTSEEKEYFSLEYFDPLHRKGRTVSVSSPSMSSSHYFFAKPPEESKLVSKDRNNWVTFDEDDGVFGRSEGDVAMESRESTPDLIGSPSSAEDSKVHSFCIKLINQESV